MRTAAREQHLLRVADSAAGLVDGVCRIALDLGHHRDPRLKARHAQAPGEEKTSSATVNIVIGSAWSAAKRLLHPEIAS